MYHTPGARSRTARTTTVRIGIGAPLEQAPDRRSGLTRLTHKPGCDAEAHEALVYPPGHLPVRPPRSAHEIVGARHGVDHVTYSSRIPWLRARKYNATSTSKLPFRAMTVWVEANVVR